MTFTIAHKPLGLLAMILLAGLLALTACGQQGATPQPAVKEPAAASSAGDATKGEQLFKSAGCVGCHTTTTQQLVGPGLQGVMAGKGHYGDKLPNGKPITEQNTAEWIKIGGVGTIGQMPGNPTLTPEEIADLVAYLKTLR